MELLCYYIVINPNHLTIKLTIKTTAVLVILFECVFVVYSMMNPKTWIKLQLAISLILCVTVISAFSGSLFLINMAEVMMQRSVAHVRSFVGKNLGAEIDRYQSVVPIH
jgi:hypothetical protein